jgi:pilus assembly protein Flp/PilA
MSASDTTELSPAAVPSPSVRRTRRRGGRGQGLVEYALILMLIAVVLIVAVQVLGNGTSNLYTNIGAGVRSAVGG